MQSIFMSILLHNEGPFCEENTYLISDKYLHCVVQTEISMYICFLLMVTSLFVTRHRAGAD